MNDKYFDPDLYWDSAFAIARSLIEYHPDKEPDKMGLIELMLLVQGLPNFKDEPGLVGERQLKDIQIEWFEEFSHL